MSAYSGPQQFPAAALRRKQKRAEAMNRQSRYEHRVLGYAIEHGVGEAEARKQMRLVGHLEHQFGGAA